MVSRRRFSAAALGPALVALFGVRPLGSLAEEIGYFGTNRLAFDPAGDRPDPDGKGKGLIDYRGGAEPDSRWRATFRFSGLRPNRTYTVVVLGRFGADGSDEADQFSPLCSFDAKDNGKGRCFWYFSGLARLDVVQLQLGNESGPSVMQASRDGGPGSIKTEPNRYSPGGALPERKKSAGKGERAKRR